MRHRPLLFSVDALGLESWRSDRNGLARLARFAPGEHTAFATWLAGRRRGEACRMVVNFADESYEAEDLPRVRGADRRALHGRRLGAWFPHPAFARAQVLGPAGAGTRLEHVLFSGLNRPEQLAPWLEAVHSAGLRLERVVPAAQLVAHLAPPSATPCAARLLVVFTRAGMRICEVHGKALHFSRLVGQCTLASARHGPQWVDEIGLTRSYILARGRIGADAPLEATVLAPPGALAPADEARARPGPASPPIHIAFPAPFAALRTCDEEGAPLADGEFSGVLLHSLSSAPAALGWPPGSPADTGQRHPARRRTATLAAALALAGLALGAHPWWSAGQGAVDTAALPPPPGTAPNPSPLPPADGDTAPPATLPIMLPPETAPPTPPQRIDGILRRPDGRDFIWFDGRLLELDETALTLAPGPSPSLTPRGAQQLRLHPGDYWPPADPGAATPPPAEPPDTLRIRIHVHRGEGR